MAKVTRVEQVGDNLIVHMDDGTRTFAYATPGQNWVVGAPGAPSSGGSSGSTPPAGDGTWQWPFQYSRWVIQTGVYATLAQFGPRTDPFTGKYSVHEGLDFGAAGIGGQAIPAASAGTVIDASYNGAQGNHVHLKHDGGFETWYFHMVRLPNVKNGDVVTKGQKLGNVGSTGWSTGNHLHFETHVNGVPVNPRQFMKDRGEPES